MVTLAQKLGLVFELRVCPDGVQASAGAAENRKLSAPVRGVSTQEESEDITRLEAAADARFVR
jgi:hypothetical protein